MPGESVHFEPPQHYEPPPEEPRISIGPHVLGYHLTQARTATESQHGTMYTLAVTGLALWAFQTYVVNPVPPQVAVAIYTLVPPLIGWIVTHLTIQRVKI